MFRSAVLIVSGNAFAALLLLARNLIVARLISVEDYGIAATFAISMAIVEMMSTLGLQQQIVQDKNGNDPHLQAGLQGFQALRGLGSGVVLFLIAHPVARFLGIEHIAWAYQVMALVPVLNGLVHFDVYRLNRNMVYLPAVLTSAVPALVSVLVLWPLSGFYGDYRVMLYAILVQAVLTVVTSHLVAERPYRLVLDRGIMSRSLKFGWPLLVNGILLFGVFNGEKLIVGRELGMQMLALFAMGVTLTLTPTLVMARSTQSFFLPQLSAAKDDHDRFLHLAMATLQCSLITGTLLVFAVVAVGDPVVRILLGEKYHALLPLMTYMAIVQGLRVFKAGPATVSLARGQTENAMIANMLRVLTLPVSWYVAATTGDVVGVLWIATIGELAGVTVSMFLMRRRVGLSLRSQIWPVALCMGVLAAAFAHAWLLHNPEVPIPPRSTAITALVLFGLALVTMGELRRYVMRRTITKYFE